jgi:antitoxin HicB
MRILYPARITYNPHDGRYLVQFPSFEEAITEGINLEEALFNAAEVLTLTLESRIDEGIEIHPPSPLKGKGIYWIAPSARVQAALLIRFSRGEHTLAELARTLETSWPAAARLEDPHHWPSLRQLERAAAAMGQCLIITLEPRH